MTTLKDPRFATGELVRVNAAVAGISRAGWTAIGASGATPDRALDVMKTNRFDVLPITEDELVTEYFTTDIGNDYTSISRKTVKAQDVIPYHTHVRDVIKQMASQARLFYFLSDDKDIVGLISVVNLNRRPVRVYLFSLLSDLELRLGEFIGKHVPRDELYRMTLGSTASGKHKDVKKRYQIDSDKGLELPLAEYLYLSDLTKVAVSKGLFTRLGYSPSEFRKSMGSLIHLRDTVAHPARSVVTETAGVPKLWNRIERAEKALARLLEA